MRPCSVPSSPMRHQQCDRLTNPLPYAKMHREQRSKKRDLLSLGVRCRGRTGAPCQPFGWWGSPARPPNRTCGFRRIRLSTCLCRGCWSPWCGDLRSSIPVARYRVLPAAIELDPFGAYFPTGNMTPDEGAHVQFGVTFLQPAHDPPEGEVIEIGEEPF